MVNICINNTYVKLNYSLRKEWKTMKDKNINPRRAGGRGSTPFPFRFLQISKKRRRGSTPFLAHMFIHLFRIYCENFRPRSPSHALQKSLNARNSYTEWPIIRKPSAIDIRNSIHKMYISEMWYRWLKVRSILRPLHCKSMEENYKVSLLDENHPKHSNIGLQVDLTPRIGILRPVTPHHVAKVISGHERSPAVFGNNFW